MTKRKKPGAHEFQFPAQHEPSHCWEDLQAPHLVLDLARGRRYSHAPVLPREPMDPSGVPTRGSARVPASN